MAALPSLLTYDGGVRSECAEEGFKWQWVFMMKNIKTIGQSLIRSFGTAAVCQSGHLLVWHRRHHHHFLRMTAGSNLSVPVRDMNDNEFLWCKTWKQSVDLLYEVLGLPLRVKVVTREFGPICLWRHHHHFWHMTAWSDLRVPVRDSNDNEFLR